MTKKHYLLIMIALFFASMIWWLCFSTRVPTLQKNESETKEPVQASTKISDAAAKEYGIEVAEVKPGPINQYVYLNGRITLNRNTTTEVRARFPGVVQSVLVNWGDTVKKGDLLATIESNESLKNYAVKSPMDGRILNRNISVGNVAGTDPLFTIANLNDVWAELHVFPHDLGKVNVGQVVTIYAKEEDQQVKAPITMLLPTTDPLSQTVIAIVTIANPNAIWRPGTIINGDVQVSQKQVPLRIKTSALQNYKEKNVVFVKKGTQYTATPVALGEKNKEWVEVKKGITAGTTYVITNSFLIKADIEKTGVEDD